MSIQLLLLAQKQRIQPLPKMIVLIVEDEGAIVYLWRALLMPLGAEFRVADNIKDALVEMAKEPYPDLVILDLRLKGTDSPRQTLEKIDAFKDIHPGTVVLVITGNPDQSLPALAAAMGADGFEMKHVAVTQDKLLYAIKTAYMHNLQDADAKPYERRVRLLEKLSGLVTSQENGGTAEV